MKNILYELIKPYKTVAFVGLCKNAGKTTALSSILPLCDVPYGVTSIGRDGERTDVVTSTPKPPVFLKKDCFAATAESLFRSCSISKMILNTTGIRSPLGEILIFRSMSDGFAEISGPSTVSQTMAIRDDFFAFGAEKVFVDGSISRRSICSPELCDAVVLSVSAAIGKNENDVAAKAFHAARLLGVPAASEKPMVLNGPLTDSTAADLISGGVRNREVMVHDGSMILLTEKSYERLISRGIIPVCERPIRIAAITVNPYSPYGWRLDPEVLKNKTAELTGLPVINVMEKNG